MENHRATHNPFELPFCCSTHPIVFKASLASEHRRVFKSWECQKLLPESLALSPQMTSSLVGALMGTLAAGPTADFLGRKTVLTIAGYIFFGCGALLGWSPNIAVLVAGRALLGVAIGLQSTTLPLYIAECAPAWIRGSLNVMPQVSWFSGKMALAG
jgi:MFS family permease